jgi:hypothetical protein
MYVRLLRNGNYIDLCEYAGSKETLIRFLFEAHDIQGRICDGPVSAIDDIPVVYVCEY